MTAHPKGDKVFLKIFCLGIVLLFGIWIVFWTVLQVHPDLHYFQRTSEVILPFDNIHAIGQTIPADVCRSHTIHIPVKFWSKKDIDPDAWIRIEMRPEVDKLFTVATQKVNILNDVIPKNEIRFTGPLDAVDIKNSCYILILSNVEPGVLGLMASRNNTFHQGNLYLDGNQSPGDLEFYTYRKLTFQDMFTKALKIIPSYLEILIITFIYLFLGVGVLFLFHEKKWNDFVWIVCLSLISGISAMICVILLSSLLKIRFTQFTLAGFFICIVLSLTYKLIFEHRSSSIKNHSFLFEVQKKFVNFRNNLSIQDMLILGLFLLALAVRLIQSADLFTPAWVDAYFHASLLMDIEEKEMVSFDQDYQLGFHILSYVNMLITDWDIPTTILMTGVWISALTGLVFYWFSDRLFHNKNIAFICAVLIWFYSPFPLYVTNWSRFPFLLGLILAISVQTLAFSWFNNEESHPILIALSFFSLAVAHYASVVFTIFVLVSYFVLKKFNLLNYLKNIFDHKSRKNRRHILGLTVFSISIILLISRLRNLIQKNEFGSILRENQLSTQTLNWNYYVELAIQHGGVIVIFLGFLGGIILFLKSRESFWFVNLWLIFIGIFVIFQLILLKGSFPSMTNLFIWSFTPLILMAGFGLNFYWKKLLMGIKPTYQNFLTIYSTIILVFCGAYNTSGFLNPKTILNGKADYNAIIWANAHLPSSSLFLINSFYWGGSYQPSDGGGWLPYWNDFKVIIPQTEEERNDLYKFIEKNDIQYYFQGNGEYSAQEDPLTQIENQLNLIYEFEGMNIFKIVDP